ncbi:MAG TPA: adenosylcobinamide-GDP ribazoletransferase [Leucothrix sp.]|nr:adenosylcobinamide-GDP ribazoletransferase [Leucothrix sp.]
MHILQRLQQWLQEHGGRNSKAFLLALSLLTRLPVANINNIQAQDSGRSALFYPFIGLIIGVLITLPLMVFGTTPALLMAAILVTLWAVITGALHLDGLADSADGWLGGMGDKEKIQTIMKDPRVGTAGVVAIVCLLLLKVSAVTALLQSNSIFLIVVAPLIARAMILILFMTTPYVNDKGMAQEIIETLPRETAGWIVAICLLLGALTSFWATVLVFLGFWLLRRLMLKLLDGCTGDTAGATVEISEVLWLTAAVLLG